MKKINTIMMIDDDAVDQKLYQRIIKRSGLVENVISFLYADEALDYLVSNPHSRPDVIFLDINMPRMSGLEFLEAASKKMGDKFTQAIIIMVTTSMDPQDKEIAMSYPAVRSFVNKPLVVEHIEEILTILSAKQ